MDELTLLRDMADRTPLPSATDLAPARARLAAALSHPTQENAPMAIHINSTQPPQQHDKATKPRRGRRRLVVSAVAVVGLAAAITGVVALGGLESVGVAPPKASAAEILHQAADAARDQPATPPRPEQFVYTKSQNPDGSIREAWLSADGAHDGLVRQMGEDIPLAGCRDGQAPVIKGTEAIPGKFEPCEPYPAYLTNVPTTAAEMKTYIEQLGGDPKSVNAVGKNISFVVGENFVAPESLAALFEALATFPGLTVDEHATDGAGRSGTGVSWTIDGKNPKGEPAAIATTLVFDPTTHVFLGFSKGTAVVERAIVDTAGQQP
jgi:hypothetical protein